MNVIDAPFHLLQKASLSLFGVTLLGIKLPALILGLITAICMMLLLRRWFSGGIAVLASILVISTGQFLFLTQNGSPSIFYLFWPTLLLLMTTLVANRAKWHGVWKIVFFVAAALSLYTPLSVYVLIAIASAILIHPHLRHIVRKLSRVRLAIAMACALLILAPLAINIIHTPTIGLKLLGIPSDWPNIFSNLQALLLQYFGFLAPGDRSILLPIFGLASMLVIIYGFLRLCKTYETVQSHVVLTWAILLLPVLIINPAFVSIMFVPLFLLFASGLEGILKRWYDLFPKNPYARVAGLLPLIVLVSSMMIFGLERYSYTYRYTPEIMQNFSRDVISIPEVSTLVVSQEERKLYEAVASYKQELRITTQQPQDKHESYAVTARAYDASRTPTAIVSSNRAENAARFYVYK
jgi:4-amino-4-deoxy-L-arabinose transferase-like glycosyltransferase